MARIRTIKPEFTTSETLVECSTSARLLFASMWCYCDDYGSYPAKLRLLKRDCFPYDDFTVEDMACFVNELISCGVLEEYVGTDDRKYWHVTNWDEHQKIDRKSKVRFPEPKFYEGSTSTQRVLSESSMLDLDHGPGPGPPPPPPPKGSSSSTQSSKHQKEGEEDLEISFENLKSVLRREGLGTADKVVDDLRRGGGTATAAWEVYWHWKRNPDRWELGALACRLAKTHPDLAPDKGWPKPHRVAGRHPKKPEYETWRASEIKLARSNGIDVSEDQLKQSYEESFGGINGR